MEGALGALLVLGIVVYFVPIIIALARNHPNIGPIAVVNIFLGWLLVGWVIALAWSLTSQKENQSPM